MKILRIVSLVIALGAGGYFAWQYFGQPNGKQYDFNSKQNIYYKGEGLDEAGAKKLATYLNEIGYFGGDKELSVQITKEKETKDTININFVVDKSKITDAIEMSFLQIGGYISQKVYNGSPVNINFIDSHFDEIKKLGYAKPVTDEPAPETPISN